MLLKICFMSLTKQRRIGIMTACPQNGPKEKPLTSVMEDYLEAIYNLDEENKIVRVKDIAKRMDVKMPTVSSMLKTLNTRGMVNYEKYEYVELTQSGASIGKEMRRRHKTLQRFLSEILDIDPRTADEEACKMEHALSAETLDSLIDFMEFIRTCPRTGSNWLKFFKEFRKHGHNPLKCTEQKDAFVETFENHTKKKNHTGSTNK